MSILDKLLNSDPEIAEQRRVEREKRLSERKERNEQRRKEMKLRREEINKKRNKNSPQAIAEPQVEEIDEKSEDAIAVDDEVKYIKPKHRKR
ncbi:MAG: hypothetical protein ACOWWR_17520 [Eubacteriales bacterium]